ncbi:PKD domain-containing protein [Persicobacter diffluens]|uniref:PKD domain-containing protein n=1 Tax=Persicobacter diffluens TaxID=981 RepID=A0AAN4W3F6_9BACT|nr:hypothetical protein PEDI_47410 [Persicobacter diffluens]
MKKIKNLLFFLTLFFIIEKSVAQTNYSWNNVAIGGGGFVSAVISAPNDPNVFYARTDVGGAYRWDEANQRWISLMDWVSVNERGLLGIDGIAVDPNVPGRLYMLAGTSYWNDGKSMFLRSEDYGESWETFDVTSQFKAHGNGMGRANGERIAVDPNNSNVIFCGTRFNGLWKSTDRGSSWQQVSSFPLTTATANQAGVCVVLFDPASGNGTSSQTIYAGVSRAGENLYVSQDGGESWTLMANRPTEGEIMPQRMAISADGSKLYITYGNGGGPHAMLWDGVTDYYNRGAVFKCEVATSSWTNISPQDFYQDLDALSDENIHYGAYSGISIDPQNEDRILVTSINSWRGTQYWNVEGSWKDVWGDNIFLTEDGGESWREMFRFYWTEGGFSPDYEMLSENGIPWIVGNTIHWNGAAVIDPYNSERAFVTSGNGVFATENLSEMDSVGEWVNNEQVYTYIGKSNWKFVAHGIEETVPEEVVSIPGGPLVSAILDYDGFVHEDITQAAPTGRHQTIIQGQSVAMGSTTGLAFAYNSPNNMAKSAGTSANVNGNEVEICAVTLSSDGGLSWNQIYAEPSPVSVIPTSGKLSKGKLAMSADGAVVVWAPFSNQPAPWDPSQTTNMGHPELFYYQNSSWSKSEGIEFYCRPAADTQNENVFYAYNKDNGYLYVSQDKGASFQQAGYAGTSSFMAARAVPAYEGHVYVPLAPNGGLAVTTDMGASFSNVEGVSSCEAVGFGKEISAGAYPTIFIYGTVGGVTGVFRSTDQGQSWLRVNDDEHEYGGLANGEFIVGDANVFGRVYMSTAGRGIVYGEATDEASNNAPIALFTTSVTEGELPLTVDFDASASYDPDGDALSYLWNFGDGETASGLTASHAYATAGQFAASLTVSDGSLSASKSIVITVNDPAVNQPPVAVASSDVSTGQAPLLVQFSGEESRDPEGAGLSYTWDFGDGIGSSEMSPTHEFELVGNYLVVLTVSDGEWTATDSLNITVIAEGENQLPIAAFEVDIAEGLAPLTVNFDGSQSYDPDGEIVAYEWSFGNGEAQTGSVVTYTFTEAGDFEVILSVTDNEGGFGTTALIISVEEENTGGGDCDFNLPMTTALPSLNKTYNYIYVIGEGPDLSNFTGVTINWDLNLNGLWQFSIQTNNGNPAWYKDLRENMTYAFNTAAPEVTFSGSGVAGMDGAYWIGLDGENLVLTAQSGAYSIYCAATEGYPCQESNQRQLIEREMEITVYPNPVKGSQLHIVLDDQLNALGELTIYTINGQEILTQKLNAYRNLISLPFNGHQQFYLLKISQGQRQVVKKILIE